MRGRLPLYLLLQADNRRGGLLLPPICHLNLHKQVLFDCAVGVHLSVVPEDAEKARGQQGDF